MGSSGSATATFFPNSQSPTASIDEIVPSQAVGNPNVIGGTLTVGGGNSTKRRRDQIDNEVHSLMVR